MTKVVSWDGHAINDGTSYTAALAQSHSLPALQAQMVGRQGRHPLVGEMAYPTRQLPPLAIQIENESNLDALRKQLQQWFDQADATAKAFVIEDDAGTNDRYVMAVCVALDQAPGAGGRQFVATLVVHGDVRWRAVTPTTGAFDCVTDPDTFVIENAGETDAYPLLDFEPDTAKSGGPDYPYRRWCPVRWNLDKAALGYPTDVVNNSFDTTVPIDAGKMQMDGDDLRVHVNGIEVDRWIGQIYQADTRVWVNLNWMPKAEGTLAAAIAATGAITEIAINEDISAFPARGGILMIGSEAFFYLTADAGARKFYGIARAQRSTAEAAHSISDTVWWVQNDVFVLYGYASATAPDTDDDYKPAFDVESSENDSWLYAANFGRDSGKATNTWYFQNIAGTSKYTDDAGGITTPWAEIGIRADPHEFGYYDRDGRWWVENPCGITNISVTGEKYSDVNTYYWEARLESRTPGGAWYEEYEIAAPTLTGTWQAVSRTQALANTGATAVSMRLMNRYNAPTDDAAYLEADAYGLTLDNTKTPTCTVGSEIANYQLAGTLTNTTTGESITVTLDMDLNEVLIVDTDGKTVTLEYSDKNEFQALSLSSARREWLRMAPGDNDMEYAEDGLTRLAIRWSFEARYYD